ncbi:conserved Plasmodium protein, unknown function [Plasmodium relictum]|uniref:RING-type domain-containing protein n=1 Tax=Plasmodium relictum TaxID=85471 RepID=A0A1J1H717_PLARL|nr:conserved Plasmodium protein, unknown function [Plasmodium relictum]CRH00451.1 conserved Plasmodium protein, unknown function [Plasmodium relictum]
MNRNNRKKKKSKIKKKINSSFNLNDKNNESNTKKNSDCNTVYNVNLSNDYNEKEELYLNHKVENILEDQSLKKEKDNKEENAYEMEEKNKSKNINKTEKSMNDDNDPNYKETNKQIKNLHIINTNKIKKYTNKVEKENIREKETTINNVIKNELNLKNHEIFDILKLNNKDTIEEKVNKIFPLIDVDYNTFSYFQEAEDDFVKEINKEISKFQNKFDDLSFLQNIKKNDSLNSIGVNKQINKETYIEINESNQEKKLSSVERRKNEVKVETKMNANDFDINEIPLKKNIFGQKIFNFSDIQCESNNFFILKRKIKRKKKKKKKMMTKYYKVIRDLCLIKKEENEKKRNRYYIFNYNCGNTKIQSITGYIRCFKKYHLYEEKNNFLRKKTNNINNIENEIRISVLLCVNVPNCISPSEFLELLYPYDYFIFFLRVLNKKNNEEYMIYFLTFDIYAKKIIKRAKHIFYFNMKKKKNIKLYLVKDITINVNSNINKKCKNIGRNKVYKNKENKTKYAYNINKFINPLYLISQNKFQLSCAVCLEALYSENLSKIISYIFNLNFEKQKKNDKKKDTDDNTVKDSVIKDKNYDYSREKMKLKVKDNDIEDIIFDSIKKEDDNWKGNNNTDNIHNEDPHKDNNYFDEYSKSNKEFINMDNEIIKKENLYLNTLNSFVSNDYNYYLSVIPFINNMQNKYNDQLKKKVKNTNNQIYNNVCINILCSHIFHSNCLKKWCFTSCPICRYKQYNYQVASCNICEKTQNVKICLFCGFSGCSFNYDQQRKLREKKKKKKKKIFKKKRKIIRKIYYIFSRITDAFKKREENIHQYYNIERIKYRHYYTKMNKIEDYRNNIIEENKRKFNKEEINLKKKGINEYSYNKKEVNFYTKDNIKHLNENKNIKIVHFTPIEDSNKNDKKENGVGNNINKLIYLNENKKIIKNFRNFSKYIYIIKKKKEYLERVEKVENEKNCYLSKKYKLTKKKNFNNKYFQKKKKKERKNIADHAKNHFCKTNHNYFFDVVKNSVYDYSSYLYIKKLINLKSENKDLKNIYSGNMHISGKEEIVDKKNIIMYIYEFNQLLSALLESQRDHFISCIYDLKLDYEKINKDNLNEINKNLNEMKILKEKNYNLKSDLKKKINLLHDKIQANDGLLEHLRNVEIINEKLCEEQKKEVYEHEMKKEKNQNIIKEKQQIIRELKQQIVDLSFHKQATDKFSQNSEIKNSSFMIGEKIMQKNRFKKK